MGSGSSQQKIIGELDALLTEKEEELKNLKASCSKLSDCSECNKSLNEKISKIEDLEKQINSLKIEIEEYKNILSEKENDINLKNMMYDKCNTDVNNYKNLLSKKESEINNLNNEINNLNNEINNLNMQKKTETGKIEINNSKDENIVNTGNIWVEYLEKIKNALDFYKKPSPLCNDAATFRNMINDTLRDTLNGLLKPEEHLEKIKNALDFYKKPSPLCNDAATFRNMINDAVNQYEQYEQFFSNNTTSNNTTSNNNSFSRSECEKWVQSQITMPFGDLPGGVYYCTNWGTNYTDGNHIESYCWTIGFFNENHSIGYMIYLPQEITQTNYILLLSINRAFAWISQIKTNLLDLSSLSFIEFNKRICTIAELKVFYPTKNFSQEANGYEGTIGYILQKINNKQPIDDTYVTRYEFDDIVTSIHVKRHLNRAALNSEEIKFFENNNIWYPVKLSINSRIPWMWNGFYITDIRLNGIKESFKIDVPTKSSFFMCINKTKINKDVLKVIIVILLIILGVFLYKLFKYNKINKEYDTDNSYLLIK